MHVVQRKIIGTLRNEKDMRIHETIMTLLATWKQRGLDPYEEMYKAIRARAKYIQRFKVILQSREKLEVMWLRRKKDTCWDMRMA